MKKILLLLIAIIISGMGLFAQEEITIGNGTGASYNAPFNNYYKHSWNETIYQKDDIGEACIINSIAYHRANNYSYSTNTIKIYMGETDRNNISSTTDWTPMSSLTLVYSGSNVIIGDSEWETFVLDVPFEYSGESNLVVVVAKTANNYTNSLNWYYTSNPNGYNVSMYRQDDNSTSYSEHPSSNSGTRLSYAANIKLGVEELSQLSTTIDYENYSLKFIVTDDELAECRLKCSTYPTVETSISISIPSTVTISGINYNVTSIANSAFNNCDYLTSIEIPNTVTSIGSNAFNDCDALSSIELPNTLTSIGEYAFYSCSILSDIEIPASVTTIGNYAFQYCTNLNSVTFAENSQLASIGQYSFQNCTSLTNIELPSTLTSINSYAFYNCTKLYGIRCFAEEVPATGNGVFYNVPSNMNIQVPENSVDLYKAASPWNNYTITQIYDAMPGEYTIIDYENYSLKFSLKSLEPINCEVTCITKPTSSTAITIPSSVTISGMECDVTSLANDAFNNCDYLTSIEIPNTVTSIGTNAFNDCDALSNADLSNALTSIGSKAFYDCDALSSIELPNALTSIGEYAFYSCSILSDIEIPASVTTIGNYAFYYCTKLGSVTFAENSQLASIGQYSFQNCTSLTNIELPSTLTSINSYAFYNCTKLYGIRCFAEEVPVTGNSVFYNVPSNMNIQVPENSVDLYKAASPWNNYKVTKMYDAIAGDNITIDYGNYSLKFTVTSLEPNECEVTCSTKPTANTSITIPSSVTISGMDVNVTSIANSAFYNSDYITSVEIPNTVTSIGTNAFYDCDALSSIELPNTLTSIGEYAFYSCSILSSIEIPSSVTSIGNYAFQYCTKLEEITFAENSQLTSIGAYAFAGSSSNYMTLSSIQIPASVTTIGNYAFQYCTNLNSVTFAENSQLASIGQYSFQNCTSLTNIELPSTLTSISGYAFYNCTKLLSIRSFAESVPSTSSTAFNNVPSNMSIQVPENSVDLYKAASPWNNYKVTKMYDAIAGDNITIDYGNYSLKFTIIGFEPTECEVLCTTKPSSATAITIPSSVTISGMECDVTALANDAFKYGYWYITAVDIPNTVTRIGNYAFYHCYDMASIEIPESVTTIGQYAFSSCSNLTSVEIPNSVTSIGNNAFQSCSNLDTLTFEENSQLATIGQYAFQSCSDLTSIEIPNSVTSIGNYAFQSCTKLTNITFEENSQLTTIGAYAFAGSSSSKMQFTSIEIPSSVTSIGNYAFSYCSNLTSIEIPSSVTSIANNVFQYCSNLTSIELPSSVTSIGSSAFYYCSNLTSIELPSTVTSIGNYAFYYCNSLLGIRCHAENVPTVYNYTFSNVPSNLNIQVPENSVDSYKAASYWKNYNITPIYPIFIGEYAIVDYENYSLKFKTTSFEPNECEVTCSTKPTANTSITIPSKATILGYEFDVTSIGYNAFNDCDYLTNIEIPNSVTSIGNNAFYSCSNLTSIEIPSLVTSIGNSAFSWCQSLANITFEEDSQLTSLGNYAFYYCTSLRKIELPASIASIGENAFKDCSNLYGIKCHATEVPATDLTAFDNVPQTMSIQVPEQSVEEYKATAPWNNYKITKFYSMEAGDDVVVDYENYSLKFTVIGVEPMECDVVCSTKPTVDTEITIPSTVTISGAECTVTSIGKNAFYNCNYLKGIEMPNTITRIESNAFSYCRNLNNVELPSSLTSIAGSAFAFCNGLTNIEFPSPLTTIAGSAFAYCDGLTSIEIPSSVTSISYNTFQGCSNLEIIIVESGNTVYDSRNNCNAIIETESNKLLIGCKNTVIPNTVTSIGESVFQYCNALTSIEIPNSVTSIGNNAFWGCYNLTNLTFESNSQLTSIEYGAFGDCNNLTSIRIPSSVTYIAEDAFVYSNSNMESISVESGNTVYDSRDNCNAIVETSNGKLIIGCKNSFIPNSINSIGSNAFYYCQGLTNLFIPNSVYSIDYNAFTGCSGLESIVVEDGNPYYDSRNDCNAIIYEYYGDTELMLGCKNTIIPNTVTRINSYAFYGCNELTNIVIPSSVQYIGENAFAYCNNLESVYCLGETLKEANYEIFLDCWNLTIYVPEILVSEYQSTYPWNEYNIEAISLEEESITIDYDSYSLTFTVTDLNNAECNVNAECPYYEDTEITIPSTVTISGIKFNVTSISDWAFSDCYNIIKIEIPSTVTSIGSYAFSNCSNLTSIEIPASVNYIGWYAFDQCSNLEKIYCFAESVPYTEYEDPFQNTSGNLIIYVPENSLYDYQNSYPWYNYTLEPIPTPDYGEEKTISYDNYTLKFVVINTYPHECEVSLEEGPSWEYYDDVVIPSNITIRGYSCNVTSIADYGFHSKDYVRGVRIPNTVTNIGYEAFSYCDDLTSINIPSSVTSISNDAFRYCNNLETISVQGGNTIYDSRNNCNAIIETENNRLVIGFRNSIIPNTVTTIGSYAFYNCNGLTTLTFEENSQLTTIEWDAFGYCDNLTSIEFPSSLITIGSSAFQSCYNLTNITFGENSQLATIGDYAFNNCSKLSSIEIPSSVTSIAGNAFSSCSNLESITVESENTVYDSRNDCNAIVETATNTLVLGCKNTIIPNTVTAIGNSAFSSCSNLTSIEIPSSVTSIGSSAFYYCSNLASVTFGENSQLASIGNDAFRSCSKLTSIEIPSSVTSIGSYGFQYCSNLASVIFGENSQLTSIGSYGFSGCSLLHNIELPSSITSIGSNVFNSCSNLYGIRCLAEDVPTTSLDAFNTIPYHINIQVPEQSVELYKSTLPWSNYNITKIYSSMPGESVVVNYGKYALKFSIISFEPAECDVICITKPTTNTSITIPTTATISDAEYTVTAIGNKGFQSCSYLTNIEMPENIRTIGNNAFSSCSKLTNIEIPDNVTYIGDAAFSSSSLKNVEISNNVMYLGSSAFSSCRQLSKVTFEENSQLTEIKESTFYGCYALTSIEIPNSITTIGNSAFQDCDAFTSIEMPNSITTIGNQAFYSCNAIVDIEIPANVTYIGYNAFGYCSKLENIYSYNITPASISWDVFLDIPFSARIYVHSKSLDSYKSQWSQYQDIIVGFVTYTEEGWTSTPISTDYAYVDYPLVISENDTLNVHSLYVSDYASVTIEEGGQLICNKSTGNVTVKKEISKSQWHTISSPLNANIDLSASSETNITSNSYELYRYDEPTHSWQDYNSGAFSTLEPGNAYLYTNSNDVTLSFTGDINAENVKYNLTKESEELSGFHLIGNPFTHNITINQSNETSIIFELTDSYGDSWNGCKLNVSFSDGSPSKTYTVSSGRSARYELVHSGEVTVSWVSGSYQNECSFIIKKEDGSVIFEKPQGSLNYTSNGTVLCTFTAGDVILADSYYTLSSNGAWNVMLDYNTPIKPCEGILVKTLNGGILTIRNVMSSTTNEDISTKKFIDITVSNNTYQDKAYITFNNGVSLDKINHKNEYIPLVYVPIDNVNYAVASMNIDFEETPIHFEAKTSGQYTISVSQENCDFDALFLYDKLTDVCVNILENDYTFTAATNDNADRFVLMTSNVKNINITINPENAGVVSGAESCYFNETVTLTARPNAGYRFVNWTENDEIISRNAEYSFVVRDDRNLTANFELDVYTITATANPAEGGIIDGAGIYYQGETITLTANATEGFAFKNWSVNGNVVSTEKEYTFVVTENIDLVANYNYSQSVSITSGWNWLSSYIEISGEEGLEMMEEALGENGTQIKTQTEFVIYSNGNWYGSLTSVSVENMYMLETADSMLFTLTGDKINPENHPITIGRNWNWIAYLLDQSISVDEAFSNITPNHGDYVKSKTLFSQYYDGLGWLGVLETMTPGEGYMYNNTSGQTKELVYPTSVTRERKANVTNENNHWIPNTVKYTSNMNMIAVINTDDEIIMSDNYEIGAFVGNELRGSARPIYIEALGKHFVFLTIHGNNEEDILFKYYNVDTEIESIIKPSGNVKFTVDGILGSLDNPYILNCRTVGLDEIQSKQFNIYPNPTSVNAEIKLDKTYDRVEIYNSIGAKVTEYSSVDIIGGIEISGVYLIKVTDKNNVKYCRLIVK